MSGGECVGCRHMSELGRERDKGPLGTYTVSFWCGLHGRHTGPRGTCPEWEGEGVPEVCQKAPRPGAPPRARNAGATRGRGAAGGSAREKNK